MEPSRGGCRWLTEVGRGGLATARHRTNGMRRLMRGLRGRRVRGRAIPRHGVRSTFIAERKSSAEAAPFVAVPFQDVIASASVGRACLGVARRGFHLARPGAAATSSRRLSRTSSVRAPIATRMFSNRSSRVTPCRCQPSTSALPPILPASVVGSRSSATAAVIRAAWTASRLPGPGGSSPWP